MCGGLRCFVVVWRGWLLWCWWWWRRGLLVLPAAVAADPVVENVVTFSDVPESSQFATEISWLAASGISTGWDAGGGGAAVPSVGVHCP